MRVEPTGLVDRWDLSGRERKQSKVTSNILARATERMKLQFAEMRKPGRGAGLWGGRWGRNQVFALGAFRVEMPIRHPREGVR